MQVKYLLRATQFYHKKSIVVQSVAKEDSVMKKFMLLPAVRAIITVVFPIVVSVLSAVIDWHNLPAPENYITLIFDIIIALVILISAIMYLTWENRSKNIQNKLDKITSLVSEFKNTLDTSQYDLSLIKTQVENGHVDLATWGFTTQCRKMCDAVHKFLTKDKVKNNVLVFISKIEQQDKFSVLGYSTLTNGYYPLRLSENTINLDATTSKSFSDTMTSTRMIYCSKSNEIKKKYILENDDNTYGQYFSIPICKRNGPIRVVARMEILTYNGFKLFDNKKDAEGYCQYYLSLITEWLETVYKIEEILRALPHDLAKAA